jgi:hypothetical protein
MYAYDTVTAAAKGLKDRGFSIDFNRRENCLVCQDGNFNVDDFEIVEVYRFEGPSDPADEAIVYGIESKTGLKGILVDGYGISSEPMTAAMAKKLSMHHNTL